MKSANLTLSECSVGIFPSLHKIFMIFLTTPVGSVACERSFSCLRRLKLWTRSTMTEQRLSGLAMILLHRGTEYIPTPQEVYSQKSKLIIIIIFFNNCNRRAWPKVGVANQKIFARFARTSLPPQY